MLDFILDNVYQFFGYVGKCYACNYKNRPVYRCPNPECLKCYCLDCWSDNTLHHVCKKCQVYEWNS